MSSKKNIVFIFRHSGTRNHLAKEGLDALLAAAAFEQQVSAVFMGDGVWQLHSNSAPESLDLPAIQKQLAALPLYDVDRIYAHQPATAQRGITLSGNGITLINDKELANLIDKADQVLNF